MQELRPGDLRKADRAYIAGIPAEYLVHFLVDALRLDRHVLEVRLAVQRALARLAGCHPLAAILEPALRFPLACHFHEELERGLRVRDDPEIGPEHPADLSRLDIDVHEPAPLRIDLDAACVPVRPAVADAEYEVGCEHRGVAVAMRRLQPDHARHERVIVGDGTPRHERGDHGHAERFGEGYQQILRRGVEYAAARDDERALGVVEHGERGLYLGARCARLVDGQRLVGIDVELDFGQLDVERQIDEHRPRPAGAHEVKRLLEHARHEGGLAHGHGPLRHGLRDGLDVDSLEVLLVEPRARCLAGDGEDRNRVGRGRVEAGNHVGTGGARSADAYADIARSGSGIALCHVGGAFDMPGEDMADAAGFFHRRIKRIDRGARHAEGRVDAFFLEYEYGCVDGSHFRHGCLLS